MSIVKRHGGPQLSPEPGGDPAAWASMSGMGRLAAATLLAVVLWLAPADVAESQPADQRQVEATEDSGADGDSSSNLAPLLIGAVLLGGGIWAYRNKKQRFPGTRFRD